ncbi:MAG: endonuclease [Acidobacteria bacterium]|nr:endonuclease [Acidobacteriota bacterium]
MAEQPLYDALIVRIFKNHYKKGVESFEFDRDEIDSVASSLNVRLPKNLGDLIYSFRYRKELPKEITDTAPGKKIWIIAPAGRARYRFHLSSASRIVPRTDLVAIKIPDATPEIIALYSLSDEQALLARVRYNRLIDIFLGITTYSLQNHLRTTVKGMGQIEIDEVYVGVNKNGQQFVIPVQAKGGSDQLAVVQTQQDLACCAEKFPTLSCRAISAQFMRDEENTIAIFELTLENDEVKVVEERHYRLVPADAISATDLRCYSNR